MKQSGLWNRTQAELASKAYQFLKGMPFDKDYSDTTSVLAVAVVADLQSEKENLVSHFDYYGETDSYKCLNASAYDVIVIARYEPEDVCVYCNLRSYLQNNKNAVEGQVAA